MTVLIPPFLILQTRKAAKQPIPITDRTRSDVRLVDKKGTKEKTSQNHMSKRRLGVGISVMISIILEILPIKNVSLNMH